MHQGFSAEHSLFFLFYVFRKGEECSTLIVAFRRKSMSFYTFSTTGRCDDVRTQTKIGLRLLDTAFVAGLGQRGLPYTYAVLLKAPHAAHQVSGLFPQSTNAKEDGWTTAARSVNAAFPKMRKRVVYLIHPEPVRAIETSRCMETPNAASPGENFSFHRISRGPLDAGVIVGWIYGKIQL